MRQPKPKPADCNCVYPALIYSNNTGHDRDCPAHKRILAEQGKDDEGPDGLMAYANALKAAAWPHTMDAVKWAEEWMRHIKISPSIATDKETMEGWFANAIMAGYDTAMLKASQDKIEAGEVPERMTGEQFAFMQQRTVCPNPNCENGRIKGAPNVACCICEGKGGDAVTLAYAKYDSDPRVNGPADADAFRDALDALTAAPSAIDERPRARKNRMSTKILVATTTKREYTGVYFDGKLFKQGHSINVYELLGAICDRGGIGGLTELRLTTQNLDDIGGLYPPSEEMLWKYEKEGFDPVAVAVNDEKSAPPPATDEYVAEGCQLFSDPTKLKTAEKHEAIQNRDACTQIIVNGHVYYANGITISYEDVVRLAYPGISVDGYSVKYHRPGEPAAIMWPEMVLAIHGGEEFSVYNTSGA